MAYEWQQRLVANLDQAIQRAAHTDPLLYVQLENLRERLAADFAAPQGPAATEAEAAETRRS